MNLSADLARHGYALADAFLGSAATAALLDSARELDARGLLLHKTAASGAMPNSLAMQMRQDRALRIDAFGASLLCQHSLDQAPCQRLEARLTKAITEVRSQLDPLLDSQPDVLQLAHYPGQGSYYMTHRDRDSTTPTRSLSLVYYLNERAPEWNLSEHGGGLHLYARGEEERLLAIVAPRHDRLVVFDSDLYHEVRPTHRSRFSLNAWVNSRRTDRAPAPFSPIPTGSMLRLVRGVLGLREDGGSAAGSAGEAPQLAARKAALLARIQASAAVRSRSCRHHLGIYHSREPASGRTVVVPAVPTNLQ
jgi:SM-20-related protein